MKPRSVTLARGMTVSLRDNTSAYGYSVTITGSYALLDSLSHGATVIDIFAAALGAVLAFTLIQGIGLRLLRVEKDGASERRRLLARMMDLFSVGAAMGAALACGDFLSGPGAWLAATFCATCVFIFMDALELSIVRD